MVKAVKFMIPNMVVSYDRILKIVITKIVKPLFLVKIDPT